MVELELHLILLELLLLMQVEVEVVLIVQQADLAELVEEVVPGQLLIV